MKPGSDFRRIWIGSASSNLADGITFIAFPLLAAAITKDPLAVAGLSVIYALPRILAVLGVGVLVDRADRRRLLYLANFSRAIMFALLTALIAVDAAPLVVLYVVYAVMGVLETVSDSSAFAVLPQAVHGSRLDRANSQIAGTQIVVDEFIGPPLGGLLFGLAIFAPTGLISLAFLLAGVSFFMLRGNYSQATEPNTRPSSVLSDIKEGAVWTARHGLIRSLIIIGTLANIGYMIPFSYLVLYADDILGLDATGYGLLLSFSALGGLLGAWIAEKLKKKFGYGWSIVGALLLGAAAFSVIAFSRNVVVVAIALAAYICHSVIWNVLASSVRQKATPHAIMGRVGSMSRLLGLSGLALGGLLGGTLAKWYGLQLPFLVAGCIFFVASLIGMMALPQFRSWEKGQRIKEVTEAGYRESPA